MPIFPGNAAFSLGQQALGVRIDPYGVYNFLIEIEGIIAGGFAKISGLEIETQVETFREGGVNHFEYKFPKGTTYSNLTLERGLTDFDLFWDWYKSTINEKVLRRNGTIYMLDSSRVPAMWWDFTDAYPIKWIGPKFDAASNTVAVETMVIAHHGLTKPKESQIYSAMKGAASNLL